MKVGRLDDLLPSSGRTTFDGVLFERYLGMIRLSDVQVAQGGTRFRRT